MHTLAVVLLVLSVLYALFILFVSPFGSGRYYLRRWRWYLILISWKVRAFFGGSRSFTDAELIASLHLHSWEEDNP